MAENLKIIGINKGYDEENKKKVGIFFKKIFHFIKNENIFKEKQNINNKFSSVNAKEEDNNIIHAPTFNFFRDNEKFSYLSYDEKENKRIYKNITMEELIYLNKQILLKKENNIKIVYDIYKNLLFYKKIVSNLEVINKYMKVLRTKGGSLPIKIIIKIKGKEPHSIDYYLYDKQTDFEVIRDYLIEVRTKYISQLDSLYKKNMNLRFLYGKQFRSIMKHLESNYNIDSILRFILNNINSRNPIKDGNIEVIRYTNDYIEQYELYNKDSFDSISNYINSLFINNNKTLYDHYEKMKINSKSNYKGIYLQKCEKNTMEEFILYLYLDKLNGFPIAQNVLITNNETSSEEIQAFLNRAILCNHNTLFAIEINNSFTTYQENIMISYLDNLLSFKNDLYNEETKENVDKGQTNKYLNSCIFFVYEKYNINDITFLNEISQVYKEDNKFFEKKINNDFLSTSEQFNNLSYLKNTLDLILIITSDICGLAKSERIRKIIKENNKKYYYFPLGGTLTKNIIYNKLENLLNKMRNENYKDIAIHLDLNETKEISIMNEFLFSFLITIFYINHENIIYIPKDIYIYIEIPNCFDNYLSKFGILSIFNRENITMENMPHFNYPKEIIDIFNRMLGINSNEELEKFVKNNIGLEKYSFHQINIFIKLFISQYSKLKTKMKFYDGNKDITKKCIKEFAEFTKYFLNGGFAKLLTRDIKYSYDYQKDYIDILAEIYDNDLNNMNFRTPLIFIIKEKEKMIFNKLLIHKKDSKKFKSSKDYLQKLKEILNLPNEVDKDKDELKSLLSIIEEKIIIM